MPNETPTVKSSPPSKAKTSTRKSKPKKPQSKPALKNNMVVKAQPKRAQRQISAAMEREHALRHERLKLLVGNPPKMDRIYKEWLLALNTLFEIGIINGSQHKRLKAKIVSTYEEAESLVSGDDESREARRSAPARRD